MAQQVNKGLAPKNPPRAGFLLTDGLVSHHPMCKPPFTENSAPVA
jgi:hypothetical protein